MFSWVTQIKKHLIETKHKLSKVKLNPAQIMVGSGAFFLAIGLTFLAGTYLPLIIASAQYYLSSTPNDEVKVVAQVPTQLDDQKEYIFARDSEFGIVIPKIHANASVVADVNPFDSNVYQAALANGVAHADGTALPTETGNMFLFAHSAGDITRARQYNAVFYLLNKLEPNDDIYVFYKQQKYRYQVTKAEVVEPEKVEYLDSQGPDRTLILMTCTPAGTTRQRLLVHAKLVPTE